MAGSSARSAAEAILATLEQAWNQHDARAFASVFSDDASFINVFGIEFPGRATIERNHALIFRTMFRDSRLAFDEVKIRPLRDDVVSVSVHWRMTGAYDPAGTPWPERHGIINFVASDDGAGWKIAVLHNMDLPDAERMAAARRQLEAAT
jgi:uncharacterized protein (TIGR02246 family)